LFDEQSVHLFAFGAGLNGDEGAAEHSLGILAGFFGGANKDDTALFGMLFEGSLTSTTCMNLGFDDGESSAECLKGGSGFIGCSGDNALGHGDTGGTEKLLALIFVNFHDHPSLLTQIGSTLGLLWYDGPVAKAERAGLAGGSRRVRNIQAAETVFEHPRIFRGFFGMNSGESEGGAEVEFVQG
jgi:hypothetical protein